MEANIHEIVEALEEWIDMLSDDEPLAEGINDPHIFKVLFTAGGPGSGKSFIAKHMFDGMGLKFSNSDIPFEALLKKRGLSSKIDPSNKELFAKQQAARAHAKKLAGGREGMWLDGMLGMVVDGTGKKYSKIKKQMEGFKAAGYDTGMVFVNTSLEVAKQRNRERARSVPDEIVEKAWRQVQANIGRFQRLFGQPNFFVVDNNKKLSRREVQTLGRQMRRIGMKWLKRPLKNPMGKNVVEYLKKTGGKTMDDYRQASQLAASKNVDFIMACLAE